MIVVDASAAIDIVLRGPNAAAIETVIATDDAVVPAVFDAEVFRALRGMVRRRSLRPDRAELALLAAIRLRAERSPVIPLLAEAWALRDRFGSGDVLYAVLARRLAARIVTTDAPFARACEGYVDVVALAERARGLGTMRGVIARP